MQRRRAGSLLSRSTTRLAFCPHPPHLPDHPEHTYMKQGGASVTQQGTPRRPGLFTAAPRASFRCVLASVGASRLRTLRRSPRALTSLLASVGTRRMHTMRARSTLANLPFYFSNYPAPRKQNRLQFFSFNHRISRWLALNHEVANAIRYEIKKQKQKQTMCTVL